MNIVLTNGDKCQDGWTLWVDGAEVDGTQTGKSATIAGLAPGIHRVRAAGMITKGASNAETSISVPPGEAVTTELTLT